MERPGAGPAVVIRRLGPGDESVLEVLARDDGDFDLDDSHGSRRPLPPDAARAHLSDPHVLHWAAWVGSEVVGFTANRRGRTWHLTMPVNGGTSEARRAEEVWHECRASGAFRRWAGDE